MIDFEYKVEEKSTNNMTITGSEVSLYIKQMTADNWKLTKIVPLTNTITYYWKRNKLIV